MPISRYFLASGFNCVGGVRLTGTHAAAAAAAAADDDDDDDDNERPYY